jgi:hypothetical protein
MKIVEDTFDGHKAITLTTPALKMTVVVDVGPRVAFLGKPDGDNLLFWDGKNLARGEWKLMGGHRVWTTRVGADESEDAYRPDNLPCEVTTGSNSITAIAPVDPILNSRRGIEVTVDGEDRLTVENFAENTGEMLYSCGVWALTCTLPTADTRYGIPLGDGSEWDCFNLVMFRKWGGGHTSAFNDDQISFTEDMLLLDPKGRETKRMLQAPYGIIAMNAPDRGCTFAKQVEYEQDAQYPLGCNMAFYVGPENFMVEMETMGAEVTLKPGERVVNRETWAVTDSSVGLDDPETLIGLFG